MVLMNDDYNLLHTKKDDLLTHLKKALVDAGLHDLDVESIHLNVKHVHR